MLFHRAEILKFITVDSIRKHPKCSLSETFNALKGYEDVTCFYEISKYSLTICQFDNSFEVYPNKSKAWQVNKDSLHFNLLENL